jgi:hypothetical protein
VEPDPRIRANWAKFSIGCIKRLDAPSRDRVLTALGPRKRERIREAGPLEWLPAHVFLDVAEAVREALGEQEAARYWRMNLRLSMEQPFVRPLVDGSLFLFGRTPGALARRTPHTWRLVARECGRWEVDPHEDERWVSVDLYELPMVFRGHMGWASVMEGGLGSLLDMAGNRGGVDVDLADYPVGRLGARVAWR